MSTVLEENPASTISGITTDPAQRLKNVCAAVRLAFTWLGVSKTLSSDQRSRAAETFGAEGEFLSAGKRLFDTRHPAWRALTAVRGRAQAYWKSVSLPYPEPGIRLIRQDRVEAFDEQMEIFRAELDEAVCQLGERHDEMRSAARSRLGSLYNAADYPDSFDGLFQVTWDFPSVEPPDYLLQLNPDLYEQESQRVQQRFTQAVQLAEDAFVDELGSLVSHLTERLSGSTDGKEKIFRDSAVENLSEYFTRFQSLNIGSSEDLDRLVEDAQQVMRGVTPKSLRGDGTLRQHVSGELARVQATLDELMIDRPRRNIIRRRPR